jgi:hypothetical protein
MILKGSQRAGGRQLAAHLLRVDENEHVEVHELRGFMADDLHGAFQEIYAASKGTRAKQPFFSLSLSPPPKERVPVAVFETAIETIEQRLGLEGRPRAIVFHEKDGRRHAHAVWSRIDTAQMKAVNLSHYKLKLRDIAKEIYLEHGWQLPRGFVSSKERDPLNFTREEWQQAQRTGHDAKALKRLFQECWTISDSPKAFAQALRSRGFVLARGDRRGFVAVDYQGEPYAIAKYTGVRTRQVRERLGDPATLPSIDEAKREIAAGMSGALKRQVEPAEGANRQRSVSLRFEYTQTVQRQRDEREKLRQAQERRWNAEMAARAARLSRGFGGIWDRLTGKHHHIKMQNERETLLSFYRDREEKDGLIFRHIEERQRLQQRIRDEKKTKALEVQRLDCEITNAREMPTGKSASLRERFRNAARNPFEREPKRERDFEPEM